jgi:hypothetical protein
MQFRPAHRSKTPAGGLGLSTDGQRREVAHHCFLRHRVRAGIAAARLPRRRVHHQDALAVDPQLALVWPLGAPLRNDRSTSAPERARMPEGA